MKRIKIEDMQESVNNWYHSGATVHLYWHDIWLENFIKFSELVNEKYKEKCLTYYSGDNIAGDVGLRFFSNATEEEKDEIRNLAAEHLEPLLSDERCCEVYY